MRSKTMPKGEARPLGTKKPKPLNLAKGNRTKEKSSATQKVVDTGAEPEVNSLQVEDNQVQSHKEYPMVLTLKNLSKTGKNAFYSGAATVLRFALSAFPDKQAPASFEVSDGIFAAVRQPKVKLTKEERAALPKPTLAERIAKREAQLAKDKAKLAAAGQL